MQENRKNFKPWAVETVYNLQEGSCAKCDRPLILGYHKHHKNGNPLDNSIENLVLYCPRCHDSEKWNTLQSKKEAHIDELNSLIQKGIEGGIAGAVLDKLLDAIKLALSLERQVNESDMEQPPTSVKIQYSEAIAEFNLKEYVNGVKVGIALQLQDKKVKK
jgi:hypothetical protein